MTTKEKTTTGSASYSAEGSRGAGASASDGRAEHHETIVVGGGQAGLSVGYHLARRGMPFVILDASERTGDPWRNRWDSLRLFTPAAYNGLHGMPFPAPPHSFPTKNEMADYLESYAERFRLPVKNGVTVDGLSRREDGRFVVTSGRRHYTADHVVVSMSTYQKPRVPAFARDLHPGIVQVHSSEYRHPAQLRDGNVLIAGAGNSGSEIAKELASTRTVWMSGRDTGHLPFRIASPAGRYFFVPLVLKLLFHRVFTVRTPVGRKVRTRVLGKGGPLIRVLPADLAAMGVKRVSRVAGVRNGLPVLEDDRVLDVTNVVWCTGYCPNFSWIDLPVFDHSEPKHEKGIVESQPGLYFCGLHFLYAMSSGMIHGVGRDAARIVKDIERIRSKKDAKA